MCLYGGFHLLIPAHWEDRSVDYKYRDDIGGTIFHALFEKVIICEQESKLDSNCESKETSKNANFAQNIYEAFQNLQIMAKKQGILKRELNRLIEKPDEKGQTVFMLASSYSQKLCRSLAKTPFLG